MTGPMGGLKAAMSRAHDDKENAMDCIRLLMAMDEGACQEEDLIAMVNADVEDGDGIDLNQRDSNAWSPLHWAASDGLYDLCKKLIEHKAFPNAKDNFGAT